MLSAMSSLIWGDSSCQASQSPETTTTQGIKTSTSRSSSTKRELNKKRLLETNIKASDGDEWVLITDRVIPEDRKAGKIRTVSTSSSSSSSPKAKKSRRKETSSLILDVNNQVPVVVKKMRGKAKADKLHRRLKDQDLLSEGDMMLQQMFNEDPLMEKLEQEEFPTIQESNLIRSRSNSLNGKHRHSHALKRGSPSTTKSYAEMAATPSSQSEQSNLPTSFATTSSNRSSFSGSREVKSPAILVVTSSLKGKKDKSKKSHGLSGTMEGSWFVTPPPCFTKPNTFVMESSPLEDELIEMPSISGLFDNQNKSLSDKNDAMTSLAADQDDSSSVTDDLLTDLTPIVSTPSSPVRLIHEVIHPFDGYPLDSPTRLSKRDQTSKKFTKRSDKKKSEAVEIIISDNKKSSETIPEKEAEEKENSKDPELSSVPPTTSSSRSESSLSSKSDASEAPFSEEDETFEPEEDEMTPRSIRQLSQLPLQGVKSRQGQLPLTEVQLNSYTILPRNERKGRSKRRKDKKSCKDDSNTDPESVANKRSPSTERVHTALLAEVRAKAYEPILQEKHKQERCTKMYLKASFLSRQNLVVRGSSGRSIHSSSRKIKYASKPNTCNTNRKTNRNC